MIVGLLFRFVRNGAGNDIGKELRKFYTLSVELRLKMFNRIKFKLITGAKLFDKINK